MISSLYTKYFQKSKVFLFPLLELPKTNLVSTFQTFIAWENIIRQEDCKLLCLIQEFTDEHQEYEIQNINYNRYLVNRHVNENGSVLYEFDLSEHKADWNNFLKGKYSHLSESCKMLIARYYGSKSNEFEYVKTYLNPKEYIKLYSELLEVDENTLKNVGELCDKYDINKEFLKFTPVNFEYAPA